MNLLYAIAISCLFSSLGTCSSKKEGSDSESFFNRFLSRSTSDYTALGQEEKSNSKSSDDTLTSVVIGDYSDEADEAKEKSDSESSDDIYFDKSSTPLIVEEGSDSESSNGSLRSLKIDDGSDSEFFDDILTPVMVNLQPVEEETIYTDKNYETQIALRRFPLDIRRENALYADNQDLFAQEVDKRTFRPLSKKVIVGGAISALWGAVTPYPLCGSFMYYSDKVFNLPIYGLGSKLLISWTVVTTTSAFAQHAFNRGKHLMTKIFHEEPFSEAGDKEDHIPHILKKEKLHYVAQTSLIVSSAIKALIPTLLLRKAELPFPLFFAFTVAPFYSSLLDHDYRVGLSGIDHLFEYYRYTTPTVHLKKEILMKRIEDFKTAIRNSDSLTERIYKIVQAQKDQNFSSSRGEAFVLSCFLTRPSVLVGEDNDDVGLLMNFKRDMEGYEHSLADDLAKWLSIAVSGAATYTKYYITQSVLQDLMIELGISSQNAEIASTCLGVFETLFTLVISNHNQIKYFQSFKNILSRKKDLLPLRRFSDLIAWGNSGMYLSLYLDTGLNIFKDYSMTGKVAAFLPFALVEIIDKCSLLKEGNNQAITNTFNAIAHMKSNKGTMLKRVSLMSDAEKVYNYIKSADVDGTEIIYKVSMKGL